ncbi:MAG: Na+/H+ antiporter subunit E [Coriobacteriia bacterium]|nr:Na+/H+ antiporter subunit E [Coriobacteriia bacterium]
MKIAQSSLALFAFWLIMTGSLAPLDVATGAVLAVLLGWWASRSLWREDAPTLQLKQLPRLLAYIAWLLKEIIVAAVYVAEKVLDPRMPIEPIIITHRCSMRRDVSRVAFANSITLTPGTLTVDAEGDVFTIHCLSEEFADSIANGALERRIMRVFEE